LPRRSGIERLAIEERKLNPIIEPKPAALFVDYENVYYFIKNRLEDQGKATDVTNELIRILRAKLQSELGLPCILMNAYADFDRIEDSPMAPLYLMGVEPHYVLGTDHKNAADMHLAIDALTIFYTRPDIVGFVLVAGDRDYIPLLQHLQQHAKRVLVVGFVQNASGDLIQIVGKENFLDAGKLLPEGTVLREPVTVQVERPKAPESFEEFIRTPVPVNSPFKSFRKLESEQQRKALEIMLTHFGEKPEVWFTPYLNRLRNEMPTLEEFERKAIISSLEMAGAVAVQKRRGEQYDYSVILVNWDHPDVQDLNP